MKIYTLREETTINAPLQAVWSFFSDPHNLVHLTPGYMRFRITNCPDAQDNIYEGMLIEYKLQPVLRIPVRWVSLIKKVKPGHNFTDYQVAGPYTLWEHTHTFEARAEGTYMVDEVHYALPMGVLGRLAHALFVKKQLQQIFRHRRRQIERLFPGAGNDHRL